MQELIKNINKRLHLSESKGSGDYKAENKHSSAVGKYQYLWSVHKDSIMSMFPEIKNKEDFKNNPEVQEKYHEREIKKAIKEAKKYLSEAQKHNPDINIEDLAMIYHYQPATFYKFAKGKVGLDYRPGSNKNKTLRNYLGKS